MKTVERQQLGRTGDFIINPKKAPVLLLTFWKSKYRMGGYFWKICFLSM